MSTDPVSLLGSLYGSLYFATILSTAFYGIACMQTFFYFVHYENDRWRIKILVAIMWALNTIHEVMNVSGAYKYIMAGLVNPSSFVIGVPELSLLGLFTVLVAIPTQGFLVYRIYIFGGKNLVVPLICVFLALVSFVCTVAYVTKALYSADGVHTVSLSTLNSGSLETLLTATLSLTAGVDVLIAICMTFVLVRERTMTSFANTAHILQRLTVFAVNTGGWTATFALLSIVLLHLFPTNTLYIIFAIPLCSIYYNTLLANLNVRAYLRDALTTYDTNLELFSPGPNSCVSDGTQGNKRDGEANLFSSTPQVVMFPHAERSTASTALDV